MNRYWNFVWIGVIFEVGWVTGLKHADNWLTWLITIICIYISMHALLIASSHLPVGTTYAVFTGLGTMGTVLIEMLVFGAPFQPLKVILIFMLVIGVMGLKMVTRNTETKGEHA